MNGEKFDALVAEYYGHLNAGRLDLLLNLFAEDATFDDPVVGDTLRGREQIGGFFQQLGLMFPALEITPLGVFPGQDGAAISWRAVGRTRDAAPVDISGINIMRTDGKRIESVKVFFDPTALDRAKA